MKKKKKKGKKKPIPKKKKKSVALSCYGVTKVIRHGFGSQSQLSNVFAPVNVYNLLTDLGNLPCINMVTVFPLYKLMFVRTKSYARPDFSDQVLCFLLTGS